MSLGRIMHDNLELLENRLKELDKQIAEVNQACRHIPSNRP